MEPTPPSPPSNSRNTLAFAAPIALIAIVIAAIIYFDVTTGGEAKPAAYIGEIGTPRRGTFVPATPAPEVTGTPRPRVTFAAGSASGTPAQRDGQRRVDLLLLAGALQQYYDREGSFATTNDNTQTLCNFPADVGCGLGEFLNGSVPKDPAGEGYWYRSDGKTVTILAALEEEDPGDAACTSDWEPIAELTLVCVSLP